MVFLLLQIFVEIDSCTGLLTVKAQKFNINIYTQGRYIFDFHLYFYFILENYFLNQDIKNDFLILMERPVCQIFTFLGGVSPPERNS